MGCKGHMNIVVAYLANLFPDPTSLQAGLFQRHFVAQGSKWLHTYQIIVAIFIDFVFEKASTQQQHDVVNLIKNGHGSLLR